MSYPAIIQMLPANTLQQQVSDNRPRLDTPLSTQPYQPDKKPQLTEHIVYLVNVKPRWNIGLCECCDNTSVCLQGAFCPCILYGKMKRNIDGQPCCGNCLKYMFCASCVHAGARRKIRTKYNLPARPCNDCCVTFFCSQCALCQEYQEGFTEHRCAIPEEQKMTI
jgi:Cys-rich protein (TIGR01571 family)